MSAPLVSIIIPIYNVEAYLRECLNSVIAQTYTNWECIMVDDASTDSSAAIAEEFCAADPRFRLLRHPSNRGLSEARNSGLDNAEGELITFIDSDDWIEPDMLETGVSNINDGIDIVSLAFKSGNGDIEIKTSREALAEILFQTGFINASVCGKIFKRKIFDSLRFTPGITYEDLDLIDRIILRAKEVCVIKRQGYYYRDRGGSILHVWNPKRMDVLSVMSEMEQRLSGDELLNRAARTRRFAANFNILLLLRKNGLQNSPEYNECREQLRILSHRVLHEKRARIKDRIGALLVDYLGSGR